jgi:ABC-2 type transport system ATP-binding protein
MPAPPAISVQQLTRRFGDALAVDRLSFDVAPGAICGVVGPNGAGKSTTFRTLCGLLRPTSGVVTVLGRDVAADRHAVASCRGLCRKRRTSIHTSGERNLGAGDMAASSAAGIPRSLPRLLALTG